MLKAFKKFMSARAVAPEVTPPTAVALTAMTTNELANAVIAAKEGAVLTESDQLLIAGSPEAWLRVMLAEIPGLCERAQEVLAADDALGVVSALFHNPFITLCDAAQEVLAVRSSVGGLDGLDLSAERFSAAGQLRLVELSALSTSKMMMLLRSTPHQEVREALFDQLDVGQALLCLMGNTHVSDEGFWAKVCVTDTAYLTVRSVLLARFLDHRDPMRAPSATREWLRSLDDLSSQAILARCPTWELTRSMRVDALRMCERGLSFLETVAPAERSTWDVLVKEWTGDVTSLLGVSTSLAPTGA